MRSIEGLKRRRDSQKKQPSQTGIIPYIAGALVLLTVFSIAISNSHLQQESDVHNRQGPKSHAFVFSDVKVGDRVRSYFGLENVIEGTDTTTSTGSIMGGLFGAKQETQVTQGAPAGEYQVLPGDSPDFKRRMSPHKLSCPNVDLVKFWKRPRRSDILWTSPYKQTGYKEKYVTFEPDAGGWNNIRMQMETVLVFAMATGRILVLPPDQPMYLLNKGKGHQNHHSFADYFPFIEIRKRMPVISMREFMRREAVSGHLTLNDSVTIEYPPGNKTDFSGTDRIQRNLMWNYLRAVAACPRWRGMKQYLIIPRGPYANEVYDEVALKRQHLFAGTRTPVYYDKYWHSQRVIHFISKPAENLRLLQHFYTFLYFDNIETDKMVKRFVRDYIHYVDIIFCKAALIVKKLLDESQGGGYSAFHTRRGELQYKEVKIPAAEILANVGHHVKAGQLVYVATDEKKKSFFEALKKRFPKVRFMDDYFKEVGLDKINPNFLGMIDQVICTRGDKFIGTWFSTFTGYITRMRGYLGKHDKTVWYGDKKHKDRQQKHELPMFPYYMREWNVSWTNID